METNVFLGIAAFFVAIGVLYLLTAGEPAGTVLLLGSAVLALICAYYFARHLPDVQASVEEQEEGAIPNELYLPHESLWPLGIGAGAVLVLAGIAIGAWVFVAGLLVLARSVVGFIGESRRRD